MGAMEHDDQPTCGKGLAVNADLPAKLAELIATQAEVLRRHTQALDLTDERARVERDAYAQLEQAHRSVARELAGLAEAMMGYRNLPMGRHDMAIMIDPSGQLEVFHRFMAIEQELLALLQQRLEREAELLQTF